MTPPRLVLADTGPLYALVDPSDGHHVRARSEMELLHSGSSNVAVVSTTFIETHRLLLHRLNRTDVAHWLVSVLEAVDLIFPTEQDFSSAVLTARRYTDQTLTLYDTLLMAVSARLDLPIWTYDYHFDILRAKRWYPE